MDDVNGRQGLRIWAVVACAGLAALAGCESAGGSGDRNASVRELGDSAGDEPIPGVVRIADVDRSGLERDGTVRYRIENLTDQIQENLSWSVVFYYPPVQRGGIELPHESDVTLESDLVLFRNETKEVVAQSKEFAQRQAQGQAVITTKIDVREEVPVRPVARSGYGQGTTFVNGQLEVVGISSEDLLDAAPPQLWIEFENLSDRKLQNLEMKVLFVDSRDRVTSETKWQSLPSAEPRASVRKTVDLSGAKKDRGGFLVKVRQRSL